MRLRRVPRRFVTRFSSNDVLSMEFGSGLSNSYAKLEQTLPPTNDETIIPNSDNVGLGLPFKQDKLTAAYSPSNFLYTDTYGISPSNVSLTVRYLTGGGVGSNVEANVLTGLNTRRFILLFSSNCSFGIIFSF